LCETYCAKSSLTVDMTRYICVAALVCFQVACSKSPQSDVERGNRFVAAGKYADAEIEYRKSVLKDPKYAEGYYRLGLLEYRLRRGVEALKDLQRAADFDPNNQRYAVQLANVSIEAYQVIPGQDNLYNQPAHEAEVLLAKDPNSFDGLRLRGDVLAVDRKYDDALVALRKANSIQPNEPTVILAIAQILFAQHEDRQAEDVIRQFLAVRKDFPPVYDVLAKHYVQARQSADAENVLQQEIAALPKNVRPRLQLAAFYRDAGRTRETSETLDKILSDRASFPAGPALVGDFYAQSRKWDDALTQYRSGIESSHDKVPYHRRIEIALEALGRRAEAIGELNEILKISPKDPDARLTRAILWRDSQDAKDRAAAIQEMKQLAQEYPRNEIVHYNLGVSYLGAGDTAAASRELKTSSDLRKNYVAPRLFLAQIAETEQNYPATLEVADEVLELEPGNFDARLLRASALIGNKSYRQAESELNSLAQLRPDSEEVGLRSAELAAAQKDYGKAEAQYRRFYRQGSGDLRPLQGLLQLYTLEHHPEKAESLLESELKQGQDSSSVRTLLASVATGEHKYDLAFEQYRWLESKDPKSPQAYSGFGDLYQLQGETQEALVSYQKASDRAPSDPKILNAIAILESNSGQARQAIATLNRQLALDPNNPNAMNNLAFNLAETGTDLDRALTLARAVARRFPNDPGVIDTLGWVYAKRGLNQSAIQVLSSLVKKYPNEPVFRYHLAVVLLQEKHANDAKRELLAALSQHPPKELTSKIQENLAQVR
jgi:tetratricopeptide (TPR) repeat protein